MWCAIRAVGIAAVASRQRKQRGCEGGVTKRKGKASIAVLTFHVDAFCGVSAWRMKGKRDVPKV